MSDNHTSRKIHRDGDFTSMRSYDYSDIREGTFEIDSFTQPGGPGTAVTAISVIPIRGRNYTISSPTITDTNITGYFAGIGLAPTVARSFDLSCKIGYSSRYPFDSIPSVVATLETVVGANGFPGATINSLTVIVDGIQRHQFTIHIILEIWGASDVAIYSLLAPLLSALPRMNFVSKSVQ